MYIIIINIITIIIKGFSFFYKIKITLITMVKTKLDSRTEGKTATNYVKQLKRRKK